MIILECEQLSPEWFQARAGIPSSSKFSDIITSTGKRTTGTARQKYLNTLAGEAVIGEKVETFQNYAMRTGVERESEARDYYSLITGMEVQEVGFCMNNNKEYGASPDGLIGEDGLLEIKCPQIATQTEYLLNKELPKAYVQQVQGQLFVTERKWLDFVSYYPGMNTLIVRVLPDLEFHKKLAVELSLFVEELKQIVTKIGG